MSTELNAVCCVEMRSACVTKNSTSGDHLAFKKLIRRAADHFIFFN